MLENILTLREFAIGPLTSYRQPGHKTNQYITSHITTPGADFNGPLVINKLNPALSHLLFIFAGLPGGLIHESRRAEKSNVSYDLAS